MLIDECRRLGIMKTIVSEFRVVGFASEEGKDFVQWRKDIGDEMEASLGKVQVPIASSVVQATPL